MKKLTLFFLLNSVPFNGLDYEKQGLELVTSCSSCYKVSSEKIPALVRYYLTKFNDVI